MTILSESARYSIHLKKSSLLHGVHVEMAKRKKKKKKTNNDIYMCFDFISV